MGLLDEVLGAAAKSMLGGQGQGGASPLAGILQQLLGGQMGGGGGGGSPLGGLLGAAGGALGGLVGGAQGGGASGGGGIDALVRQFSNVGLGDVVNSWVGTGANLPVSPQQLLGALGQDNVQSMASGSGLPVDQLLSGLSQHLPAIIDALTPNGKIPEANSMQSMLGGILGQLGGGR